MPGREPLEALAIYGLDGEPGVPGHWLEGLERDRSLLKPAEFAWVSGACYELLLIWADVEAAPGEKAENAESARQRGERALSLLDRTALVGKIAGLDTRAWHVRKARYLALSRGEKFDPAKVDPACPGQPTGVLDWFQEALESFQVGNYEQAGKACRQVLDREREHFWGHFLQAMCHLRFARWLEAKADLTVCTQQRPDFPWAVIFRGFAASALGSWHAEQEHNAKQLYGQNAELTRTHRQNKEREFTSGLADFDRALRQKLDSQELYTTLTNRGTLFIRQERWPEAIADLEKAVQTRPAAFQAYINLAQALEGARREDELVAALTQAIEKAPNLLETRADLYDARARLHRRHRDHSAERADLERAIRLEEQAVALEPSEPRSRKLADNLVELGKLLSREGKHQAALTSCDRAIQIRPELVLAERFRAEALLALHRPKEAAQALDQYLANTRDPEPKVLQVRGLLYSQMGDLPAAIDAYSASLRITDSRSEKKAKDVTTRGYRGWVYLQVGATRLALEDFENCLREKPDSADYLIGRASARIRLRQRTEALHDVAEAEKQATLPARLRYYLGCTYAQAAALVELESRTSRSADAEELALYERKALQQLNRALEDMPPEQRSKFWSDQVQTDPALTAVRRHPLYLQLAKKYGQKEF